MSKIIPREEIKDDYKKPATQVVAEEEFIEEIVEEPKKEEPKSITLTKEELTQIIKDAQQEAKEDALSSVEPQLGVGEWQEKGEREKRNSTARMRLYQHDSDSPLGLVTNLKFHKNKREETVDGVEVVQYYKMTVLYDDGKEEDVEISLLDFSRVSNYETVEIIESEEKPLRRVLGKVLKTLKVDGYSMSGHVSGGDVKTYAGSDWVDQEEVRMQTTHTIKRPNGQTLKLDNNRLNL